MRIHRAIPAGLLALLVAAGYYSLGGSPAQHASPAAPPPAIPVAMAPVRSEPASLRIETVGSLIASESVVLRPEIDGRILDLPFEEGQAVAAGQVLVRLEPSEHRAEVARREAMVTLWGLKARRARDLLTRKAVSPQEVDEAQASLKEARAGLALMRSRLEKTVLRAPFAGILGLRRVSPGDYVEAGQDLVNLEAIDPIKIDLRVAERYAAAVGPGKRLTVRLDAFPDRNFSGEVYAIDPRLDSGSRSLAVRGRIPNPDGLLRPGMFARSVLDLSVREEALWAPEQALVPMPDAQKLYRVVDGKAVLTTVTIGLRSPGKVEIRSGLAPGDTVVIEGQAKLRDGDAVEEAEAPG